MYAGHFACAVALLGANPRTPRWVPFVGIGVLDLLDGVGVAAGVERISPDPDVPLGISLDYIDWDHSLVMALAWSIAFAVIVARRHRERHDVGAIVVVGFLAVFSHFVTDAIVHNGDLALWPGSDVELGLYLWQLFPIGSWFVELALVVLLCAFGVYMSWREERVMPREWRRTLVVIAVLQLSFLPPLSALRFAGTHLDGRALDFTYAALVIVGFLVPAWILSRVAPRREEMHR